MSEEDGHRLTTRGSQPLRSTTRTTLVVPRGSRRRISWNRRASFAATLTAGHAVERRRLSVRCCAAGRSSVKRRMAAHINSAAAPRAVAPRGAVGVLRVGARI